MRTAPAVVLLLLVATATYASLTRGSSGGLTVEDGAQRNGCTCHCATAGSGMVAKLDGLPAQWEAAKAYDITVSFSGGPTTDLPTATNEGGFAIEASHGTFATKDDKTQVKKIGGADRFATHTAAGNDQSSWPLKWTAPSAGAGEVTFNLATNDVNGDGQNGGGSCTDNWAKIEKKVPEKPAPAPPPPPPSPPPSTPPPGTPPTFEDDFERNGTTNGGNESAEDGDDDEGFLPGFGILSAAAAVAIALLRPRRAKR